MGGDQRADSVSVVISVFLFITFSTVRWFKVWANLRVLEVAGYPGIPGLETFLGTLSCMLPLMTYSRPSGSALSHMEKFERTFLASLFSGYLSLPR